MLRGDWIMSDERTVTETRDVSGFDGVRLEGFGSVTVTQGDHTALTIEAAEDVMPRVTAKVKDGVLVLGIKKSGWMKGLGRKKLSIRFNVTTDRIRKLVLAGVGRIDAPRIDSDELSLVVSGAGAIAVGALRAESLGVVLSGAGSCEVGGRTTSQSIRLSGAGSYTAPDLECTSANADVSGAGSITIRVRETLDAKISGTGSIRYQGAPTVRQRVTGVGTVTCTCCE
jgi:hypothetical protein